MAIRRPGRDGLKEIGLGLRFADDDFGLFLPIVEPITALRPVRCLSTQRSSVFAVLCGPRDGLPVNMLSGRVSLDEVRLGQGRTLRKIVD